MPSIEDQLVITSRALADVVVANIGSSQTLFDETMELLYRDEYPISMRAGWIANFVAQKYPQLVRTHFEKLVRLVPNSKIDGVKRSVLKMFMETPYELSEEILGELADLAFSLAEDQKQAVAIRASAIDILLKVMETYPEIEPELIAVMESMIPDGSRGLRNKCRRTIDRLKKKKAAR